MTDKGELTEPPYSTASILVLTLIIYFVIPAVVTGLLVGINEASCVLIVLMLLCIVTGFYILEIPAVLAHYILKSLHQ